ncbi:MULTISPECIES: metallothiol transferase FosB [Pontibacillus]|uniref:Metallothiol transferase FosB n=1 Tax=Pontibacillus chungwhensis TaxID=265426 RepID=A0ABY8V8V6_9BACI|nr:metallothiol transferase FosB [Pontibacillus chungwhensis]MCD5325065.1 metallothiol transferase FosB [Pontibacillus sp. HN14]WIG00242.1 metallothiol transferase FosB [Pontibacillus chungwhensis]
MDIQGINHITFSVSDLPMSIKFYEQVLGATLLVEGEKTAYFDLNGLWIALNMEKEIPRREIEESYTHIAFTVAEESFQDVVAHLKSLDVRMLKGRKRDELDKKSIYFTDPDGHKFEFHTGTLEDRLSYYRQEKENMRFYT